MREHRVVAWGHKRVWTSVWSTETHYYRKCACGFKATSPNVTLVETAMDIHLGAHRGATAGS